MNNNVSTTYVPLQPPYQIIKYGKEVGMQIGTLIATEQVEGDENTPFKIATHSYPVVAYANKTTASKAKQLFDKDLTEGVVWNRVELQNVSTICLTDSHLPWQEFIDALWRDITRTSSNSAPQIQLLYSLRDLGVDVDPLQNGTHTLHLQTYCDDEGTTMVRTSRNDKLVINVELEENLQRTLNEIKYQVTEYKIALLLLYPPTPKKLLIIDFEYTTDDENLKPLVDLLNSPQDSKEVLGRFSVRAIDTYEKGNPKD